MCSLTITAPADGFLNEDKKVKKQIEKNMIGYAKNSTVQRKGALDDIHPTARWDGELKEVKKKRVGRHRVYFIGFHTRCTYKIVHVKVWKKTDVDEEDDPNFKRYISKVMNAGVSRTIAPPD